MKNTTLIGGQKRPYQKPSLLVESMQLAQSIALSCSGSVGANLGDASTCNWDDGTGMNYFLDSTTKACDTILDADIPIGDYCYNNPDGGNSVFGS